MTATSPSATAMSGASSDPPRTDRADPGLVATLRSEWIKARTARAPRRNLLLGTVLGIGFSLLLAYAAGASFDDWTPAQQADFDPITYTLSGALPMTIFYVTAVVGLVAPEYASRMMGVTLLATPRRSRVLLSKVIVATVATSIATLVAVVVMMAGGQMIYGGYDLPTVSLTDGDLLRTVVMLVATGPVFPVFAVAMAVLFRSAAAAISATLALVFLPSMFGGALPGWWERNLLSLLPGAASDSLSLGHLVESPQHLNEVAAVVVLVVWTTGLLVLAGRLLAVRDA